MFKERLQDIIVSMLDCDIIVSEFKLQPCYYIHFRTNIYEDQ